MSSIIRTTGYNQYEILENIIKLHIPSGVVHIDPTYSKGVFYEKSSIERPEYCSDIMPKFDFVNQHCASSLPFEDGGGRSIVFDPPFLAGYTKPKPTGRMGERFHGFRYIPDLWDWYDKCLNEFSRVLGKGGVLVFKCQDTVSSGKQWFSHCHIYESAMRQGFYPKDLFILNAKARMIGHNHSKQKHARKFHSYFWVFEKRGSGAD